MVMVMITSSRAAGALTRLPGLARGRLVALAFGPAWWPYVLLALVQAVAAVIYLSNSTSGVAAGFDSFPLDDGWIHMVYARSFGENLQFFYNPGEPESGMTSPLWAVTVGAGWRVLGLAGISLMATAKLIAIALSFATAVLVMRIVTRISGLGRLGIIAGILVVAEPSFAFAGAAGMEVTLFAFLALAACSAYMGRRLRTAGWLLGLAAIARPEGYVLVGVVVAASVARRLWERQHLELISREDARELLDLLLPTLILGGAWALYNVSVSGGPFPNTFYAKHQNLGLLPLGNIANILRGYYHHLSFFWSFVFPVTAVIAAAGAWMLVKMRRFHAVPLALFPIGLTYAASVNLPFVSSSWNFFTRRYLDAAIPFLIILLVLGLLQTWRTFQVWRATRAPADPREVQVFNFGLNVLMVALVLLPFLGLLRNWSRLPSEYSWNARSVNEVDVATGKWIAENLPADARIGVGDAGAMRFFGDRYTYDLVGLNTHDAIGRPPIEFAEEKQLDFVFVFRSVYFDSWPEATPEYEVKVTPNPYPILGGAVMGGYRADWISQIVYADNSVPHQIDIRALGMVVIDEIDPGNAEAPAHASEEAHAYELVGGGVTVERQFRTVEETTLRDEARTFTVAEAFTVKSIVGERLIIAKRYDAAMVGRLRVFADDQEVGEWELEPRDYFFGEDTFVVPASFITRATTDLRVEVIPLPGRPTADSFYYWLLVDEGAASLGKTSETAVSG